MFEKIILFSVQNRAVVLAAVALMALAGIYSMRQLPLDAVPDITNNQVQVVTSSPSLAPEEVERFITHPLELSLGYVPDVLEVRSISRYGLSIITIVFPDNHDILSARQLVQEQLNNAAGDIPIELGKPELMPITTGLGEIYQYTLQVDSAYRDMYTPMALRSIQDWIVKRQFTGTKGLVEVSSFGGYLKQYEVAVNPAHLRQFNLGLEDVQLALASANLNSGGGIIQQKELAYYIRTEGLLKDKSDIEQVVVSSRQNVPTLIKDIAEVRDGYAPRFGAMSMDGQGEVVGGITLMLKGASSSQVISEVHERVAEIQASLPPGVHLEAYLDRSDLVGRTIKTVVVNLLEGGLIVIFVLIILLGNVRAGIIVTSIIPLAMMLAFILMHLAGVSANLMSLGAIDFGIVVDGAVIIVEHILVVLVGVGAYRNKLDKQKLIASSAGEIYRAAAFGVLIILVVFLPVLALQGIEGKMFRPLVLTFGFAILGAFILSLTYIPAISSVAFQNSLGPSLKWGDSLIKTLKDWYKPVLRGALRKPGLVLILSLLLIALSIVSFSRMGQEFMPQLEEGDLAVQMSLPQGSGLEESLNYSKRVERSLLNNFPEVVHVVSKIGASEVPTDPMGVNEADIMIILKPKEEWTSAQDRAQLMELMKEELSIFRGISFEFTQPIELRFNELITGSKSDIAVKIFGEDLQQLSSLGAQAESLIADIEGVGDVKLEQTAGLPQMRIEMNRKNLAVYGISSEAVQNLIQTAYSGAQAGVIYEGQRAYDLVVRYNPESRESPNLDMLFITAANGSDIPLSELTQVSMQEGPALISREQTQRRISIGVNVRNRDLQGVVLDIKKELNQNLRLPAGYYLTYGGEFESLQSAKERLLIVVPLALLLIFILLYFTFNSFKLASLIFAAIPLAAVGGIYALWLRDLPFSISAGIGFITLFGVSVLNGIVLVSHLNGLLKNGAKPEDLLFEGPMSRLRAVLTTAVTTIVGFLPMAISTSAGAEVQRPLATVVIGGLFTATLLTLVVLPVLYQRFYLGIKPKNSRL